MLKFNSFSLSAKSDHRIDRRGINMVDLMMWLVIAALLLAAAIQGIGYYQKAAYLHQLENDLSNIGTLSMAKASDTGVINKTVVADAKKDAAVSTTDALYSVKNAPWDATEPIIIGKHPSVPDSYVMYLFEPRVGYNVGINVIKENAVPEELAATLSGKGEDPIAHPYMATNFNDQNASPGSTANLAVAFAMPQGGIFSDYKVEWSQSGVETLNATFVPGPATAREIWGQTYWTATAEPKAGGFASGSATITAKITELASGDVSTKSWNVSTDGSFSLVYGTGYESIAKDGFVLYAGSKADARPAFKIQSTFSGAYAPPITYSVDSVTGSAGTTVTTWGAYGDFRVQPANSSTGYTAGTSTAVIKAVHTNGKSATISVPIKVVATPTVTPAIRAFTTSVVTAGSTSTATLNSAVYIDQFYGSLKDDANMSVSVAPADLTKINALAVVPTSGWNTVIRGDGTSTPISLTVQVRAGGFTPGVIDATLNVQNKMTGKTGSYPFKITVQ